MSDRDQTLVRSLGMSVAQMAGALDKSRQTVNRGIQANNDYFKPPDLVKFLNVCRGTDTGLYSLAKAQICDLYPEIADAVLQAAGQNGPVPFSVDVPGEYWFISGDLVGFRTNLNICSSQIEALCSSESAQVKLFINDRDFVPAQRMANRFKENPPQVIPCKQFNLALVPSTLLRMTLDDDVDLFGVSDAGFVALSRQEAHRLRLALHDTFLDTADAQ